MLPLSRGRAFVGVALLGWAFIEFCINESLSSGREIWNDPSFSVFLFLGDLLLLLWMWGVSIHVWRRFGIPWDTLLGIESTPLAAKEVPENAVYESAANLSNVYLATFIVFNWGARGSVSASTSPGDAVAVEEEDLGLRHFLPVALLGYFIYQSVSPWEKKKQWWFYLKNVSAAPLFIVTFRCGYIGDILTSLVRVLSKALYSFLFVIHLPSAFVTIGGLDVLKRESWWLNDVIQEGVLPWLTLFPLWLRLMQCLRRSVETSQRWPHIANALKYTSAIMVIGIGALAPDIREENSLRAYIWLFGFVFATMYQFCWDITMDWGLLTGVNQTRTWTSALRKRRLLGPLWVYLTIMIGNFVLRFAWTLTLLPSSTDERDGYGYRLLMAYLTPVIAAAEVLRRMVWGFLRLEWEYIEKEHKIKSRDLELQHTQPHNKAAISSKEPTDDNSTVDSDTLHAQASDVSTATDLSETPFTAMGMNTPSESSSSIPWLASFTTFEHSQHINHGSFLYNPADPDGRFQQIPPVLTVLLRAARYAAEAIVCVVHRAYETVEYVTGSSSSSSSSSSGVQQQDERFKHLFNDASWLIAPLPQAWSTLISRLVDWFMVDKLLPTDSESEYESYVDASYGNGAFNDNKVKVPAPAFAETKSLGSAGVGADADADADAGAGASDRVATVEIAFDTDRKRQYISEAVMFAALLLTFLIGIAFL
eukprot:GSChrysophyteH1.ASY1.ANO1.149.1 assembled CDS